MDKRPFFYLLFIIGLLFTLTGCKPSESAAEKAAIAQFRTQLAASQYHEIYASTSRILKDKTPEDALIKVLKQSKLSVGTYTDGSAQLYKKSVSAAAKADDTEITRLYYRSSFSKYSSVEEEFDFEKTDDGIKLAGYSYGTAEHPLETAEEKAAITQFRTQLAAAQYHEIYVASSNALKNITPEDDFVKMLKKLNSELGTYSKESAKLYERDLLIPTKSDGITLNRLSYHSSFSKYSSVEEVFNFEETNEGIKLAGLGYKTSVK